MKSSIICIILASFIVDSYALPTTTVSPVDIATTVTKQYHATCAEYAASIKRLADSKTLVLRPGRRWWDEFAWSGGFYLTPNPLNAIAFGASFVLKCASLGGVVIIEFSFDPSDLKCVHTSREWGFFQSDFTGRTNSLDTSAAAQDFWNKQRQLGIDIRTYAERGLPPVPPGEPRPVTPPPTPEQIASIRNDVPSKMWPAYDDFQQYDLIVGAVKMTDRQQRRMDAAINLGMPPIQNPFTQVVLVTDAGKQSLSEKDMNTYVEFSDCSQRSKSSPAKQPAVKAAFKALADQKLRRGFSFWSWDW
ncbi:hypothetical protein C8R46DRAFT_1275348 [Mycena filopes]|nr:hypothetical protein C8R46DRAFT_1275348 [Mycena filopes]